MSRQSPIGFAFSTLLEIAAVVAIVSFLPKFDLRPAGSAAADQTPPATADGNVSPVAWTDAGARNEIAARPTSYYERPPAAREAPPLIEVDANRRQDVNRPQYVEQRLDQASQQLVNGVGSAVATAADQLRRDPSPIAAPAVPRRQPTPPQQTPPRPWMRY